MPLYEYHCNNCGLDFEALVPFAEADKQTCDLCGSKKVERLASSFCASGETTSGSGGKTAKPPCFSGG